MDDVAQFGQTLLQFEKDLEELREHREAQKQTLREIQSNMLKGVFVCVSCVPNVLTVGS